MRLILIVASLFLAAVSPAAAQMDAAVVNVDRLIAESPQGKAFIAALQQKALNVEGGVKVVQQRTELLRQRIIASIGRLNAVQLKRLQAEVDRLVAEETRLRTEGTIEFQTFQETELAKLEQIFLLAVQQDRVQAQVGLILIFDDTVVSVGPGFDRTDAVLARLRTR